MNVKAYPLCARADALSEHYKTAAELLAHPSTGLSKEQAVSLTLRLHFMKTGMGPAFDRLCDGTWDSPTNFYRETK